MQVQGPAVEAESGPGPDHLGHRVGHAGRRRRPPRHELVPAGHDGATWVCCSMSSLTSTAHGSRVRRQGSSRHPSAAQPSRAHWSGASPAGGTATSAGPSRGGLIGAASWRRGLIASSRWRPPCAGGRPGGSGPPCPDGRRGLRRRRRAARADRRGEGSDITHRAQPGDELVRPQFLRVVELGLLQGREQRRRLERLPSIAIPLLRHAVAVGLDEGVTSASQGASGPAGCTRPRGRPRAEAPTTTRPVPLARQTSGRPGGHRRRGRRWRRRGAAARRWRRPPRHPRWCTPAGRGSPPPARRR